jgi:hypothetical protein
MHQTNNYVLFERSRQGVICLKQIIVFSFEIRRLGMICLKQIIVFCLKQIL